MKCLFKHKDILLKPYDVNSSWKCLKCGRITKGGVSV